MWIQIYSLLNLGEYFLEDLKTSLQLLKLNSVQLCQNLVSGVYV